MKIDEDRDEDEGRRVFRISGFGSRGIQPLFHMSQHFPILIPSCLQMHHPSPTCSRASSTLPPWFCPIYHPTPGPPLTLPNTCSHLPAGSCQGRHPPHSPRPGLKLLLHECIRGEGGGYGRRRGALGGYGSEESWEEERGQGTVPITLTCQASALGICIAGGDKTDAPSSNPHIQGSFGLAFVILIDTPRTSHTCPQ